VPWPSPPAVGPSPLKEAAELLRHDSAPLRDDYPRQRVFIPDTVTTRTCVRPSPRAAGVPNRDSDRPPRSRRGTTTSSSCAGRPRRRQGVVLADGTVSHASSLRQKVRQGGGRRARSEFIIPETFTELGSGHIIRSAHPAVEVRRSWPTGVVVTRRPPRARDLEPASGPPLGASRGRPWRHVVVVSSRRSTTQPRRAAYAPVARGTNCTPPRRDRPRRVPEARGRMERAVRGRRWRSSPPHTDQITPACLEWVRVSSTADPHTYVRRHPEFVVRSGGNPSQHSVARAEAGLPLRALGGGLGGAYRLDRCRRAGSGPRAVGSAEVVVVRAPARDCAEPQEPRLTRSSAAGFVSSDDPGHPGSGPPGL